jgi:hypothetical protein
VPFIRSIGRWTMIAAAAMFMPILCMAEVASQFSEPGGPYLGSHRLWTIRRHADWVVPSLAAIARGGTPKYLSAFLLNIGITGK